MNKLFKEHKTTNKSEDLAIDVPNLIPVPPAPRSDELIDNQIAALEKFLGANNDLYGLLPQTTLDNISAEATELLFCAKEMKELFSQGKLEETIWIMNIVARGIESINATPYKLSAYNNQSRLIIAAKSTNSHTENDFADLTEKAQELIQTNPSIRIGQIASILTDHYGYSTATIRKRLIKLDEDSPFLPESCFKIGRPKKV